MYITPILFLSRYAKSEGDSPRGRQERGRQGNARRACMKIHVAGTSESERRYELPKLPFDSSDKLCKQFDRRSYRFAVEL